MDSGNIDIPNSKALVKQILTLAQDVDNQPFIAQEDGCLAGLCNYLNHEDTDVVLMASRSIEFLSSHPVAREKVKEFPDLVSSLIQICQATNSHPKAKEFCENSLRYMKIDFQVDASLNDENATPNFIQDELINLKPSPSTIASSAPDYLDEDEYDDDDDGTNDKVTRWGSSSLEDRLEEQRRTEQQREKNARLIGKVGTIFSNPSGNKYISWLLGY